MDVPLNMDDPFWQNVEKIIGLKRLADSKNQLRLFPYF